MPDNPALSKFHAAIAQSLQSSAPGPVNAGALLRDKDLALQKGASLHGYHTYLTQCRQWKARHKSVRRAMEREVQVQASQALADARDLATATLRMTRHLKEAGYLDRLLDSWIAGVKASGPVQLQDVWTGLASETGARQLLRDQGLSDELFAAIDENMKQLDGQIALQGGKVSGELKLAGQERTQHIVMGHSASGPPRTLHELLSRGQFERVVEQFEHGEGLACDLVAGPSR